MGYSCLSGLMCCKATQHQSVNYVVAKLDLEPLGLFTIAQLGRYGMHELLEGSPWFEAWAKFSLLGARDHQGEQAVSYLTSRWRLFRRTIENKNDLAAYIRGGLQLPNFSENPNNVRKWVGGVNACSD